MSQVSGVILKLLCVIGCLSGGRCYSIDELSLIQAETRAMPPKDKWPDIGKVVEEAKKAADAATKAAEEVNSTIEGAMDEAANATKTAIDLVVHTVRTALEHILKEADALNGTLQEAVDAFLGQLEMSPTLHTFEKAAADTIRVFNTSYDPVVYALNTSAASLQSILKASGFLRLADTVGEAMKAAMVPIAMSRMKVELISGVIAGLDARINASAGAVSGEIKKDFAYILDELHDMIEDINSTFIPKVTEVYDTLVSHIRSTVEGVLPTKYLNEVTQELETLSPMAANVAQHVASPMGVMQAGFEAATSKIQHEVPGTATPGGACGAAGVSLLALAVGVAAAGM